MKMYDKGVLWQESIDYQVPDKYEMTAQGHIIYPAYFENAFLITFNEKLPASKLENGTLVIRKKDFTLLYQSKGYQNGVKFSRLVDGIIYDFKMLKHDVHSGKNRRFYACVHTVTEETFSYFNLKHLKRHWAMLHKGGVLSQDEIIQNREFALAKRRLNTKARRF